MKIKNTAIVLFVLLVACSNSVVAQDNDIKKRIAKCAAIKGELERLECFDTIAKDLGLIERTEVVSVKGRGKWRVSETVNPMDDSKTVTLMLDADGTKSRWGGPITLIIRCMSNKTEAYISWSNYLGSEAIVTTRIGDEAAKTNTWSLSTDSKATFWPGSKLAFIRSLLTADTFVAQVTPYSESPVTAVFDIKGLSNAIVPLQVTCGWK